MASTLRRLNWLFVHEGTDVLRVETINERSNMLLARDCHSMIVAGKVFSFVRLTIAKKEHTMRSLLRKVLACPFEVHSFANAGNALQCPGVQVMLERYQADSETLVSTWVNKSAARRLPSILFGAMVSSVETPRVFSEDRAELVAQIESLERERDEYKRKYEAMAEQFCTGSFD